MKQTLRLLSGLCLLLSCGCASAPDDYCMTIVRNTKMLSQEQKNSGNYTGSCGSISDCKLVVKKPNFGYCATNTAFEERELKPGEQMCCTATEVVVKNVPENSVLVCNASDWYVVDTLVPGKPDVRKRLCCTANVCKSNEFNAYQRVAFFCTATDAFAIIGGNQGDIACTNNECFEPFRPGKFKLVCKQFLPPPK